MEISLEQIKRLGGGIMLFFLWKKYEGDWLATTVSMLGSILITLGSMGLIVGLNASLGGFSFIIGVAAFLGLKILLNRLTNAIDKKYNAVTLEIGRKMDDNKEFKQMAIINEGTNQKKIFNIVKKEVLNESLVIAGVRKLTDQSLIESVIRHYDSQFPKHTSDSHIRRIIMEAINRITDENQRNSWRHYINMKNGQ